MDEKDWMMLNILSQEKNITKTAERLYISQPSLTYRLNQIEKDFNITLLFRGRRGVEFTEQGEVMVRYAQEMLSDLAKIKESLSNMEGKVEGTLRLAVARSIALYKLPKFLRKFSDTYPLVDYKVSTGLNMDLIVSVFKQDAQIGVVRGDHHWAEEKEILDEETISVISVNPIDISMLPGLPRITYNTDPALIMTIENWWKMQFSQPSTIIINVDNMEIAKRMVKNKLGYAIVPSLIIEDVDKDLCQLPLSDKHGNLVKWTTWMLYRKEFLEMPTIRAFIHFIREYYKQI
ncbi:LysR family transcriptional regulator [Paenibacillus camerounensis]|uniref:LysR family transcriptional regulator n=1 Tax=Paenibacillus camerounensis TaxID=1243663 RepID=UPI0005A9E46E|nr:LysR family transcriptional regulator [Paenibacillus camerounensis]